MVRPIPRPEPVINAILFSKGFIFEDIATISYHNALWNSRKSPF
jgi:hypothetical protein